MLKAYFVIGTIDIKQLNMKQLNIKKLTQQESLSILCGEKLGEGSGRIVYRNEFDNKLVVKVAINSAGVRANIEEFNTWECVQFVDKINVYFAKVYSMTELGSILIQEYISDIPKGNYKIPSFFTDLKPENYGVIYVKELPQIVCRDYGLHLLREKGMRLKLINYKVN
jgi:hypothetical protein